MRVIIVNTKNEAYIKELAKPIDKAMREIVDGYIEVVKPQGLDESMCMVVNEEGIIYDLPVNAFGCLLYRTIEHGSPIVGNVIIAKEGYTDEGLDFVDFDDDELEYVFQQITSLNFISEKENK